MLIKKKSPLLYLASSWQLNNNKITCFASRQKEEGGWGYASTSSTSTSSFWVENEYHKQYLQPISLGFLTWIKGQSLAAAAAAAAGSSPVQSPRVPVFQSEHTGTYQHPHRRHFNAASGFEWFG